MKRTVLASLFVLLATSVLLSAPHKKRPPADVELWSTTHWYVHSAQTTPETTPDFGNSFAVILDSGNHSVERRKIRLRNGRFRSIPDKDDSDTEVRLEWVKKIPQSNVVIVEYVWITAGIGTSTGGYVQVFKMDGNRLIITQQIEFDMSHGGKSVGTTFDSNSGFLKVRSINGTQEGYCCPTTMDISTFQWNGVEFLYKSTRNVPLPKD